MNWQNVSVVRGEAERDFNQVRSVSTNWDSKKEGKKNHGNMIRIFFHFYFDGLTLLMKHLDLICHKNKIKRQETQDFTASDY